VRRRQFLRAGAASALAVPALAAPAVAQSAPEIKWRMTSSFPKSLDTIFGTAQALCRFVAEATDGRFQILPHAAGELTASRQALGAVASGAIECAHTPLFFYAAKDPVLGVASGLPFGLNARQQLAWWSTRGGGEIVNAALKKFNAYGLPAGSTGTQMGAWFKKEINTLEDLKGLRFRVGALAAPILARIGMVPHHLTHADVYSALESGTIDAAEFICPYDDEKLGIVKVAKFNHYPCWWESAGMVHLVANLEKWNELPKSYRAILACACDAANAGMLTKYDGVNPPAFKRLIAAGAVVRPFPQAVMEAAYRACNEHFAEQAGKDPAFKRALESVLAYRKESLPWWQISDHAIDSFIIAARGRS
jgi:TRAP-type mannitol/chloroaromatic compound transport system substrate-binding protein